MKNISTRLVRRTLYALLLTTPVTAPAAPPISIPMTADRWTLSGSAELVQHQGVAALHLKDPLTAAEAIVDGITFTDGTIEYDAWPTRALGPAVGFRRRDASSYESFYVRQSPRCDEAWDCTQYAPVMRGTLLWNLFPQHQSAAPLRQNEWNRVKLVISGRRLRAYVNDTLALRVDRLRGDSPEGGIVLQGAGFVANVRVAPGAIEGLDPRPAPDEADPRMIRHWSVSPPTRLAAEKEPALDDMPAATPRAWRLVAAEAGGLVNLSRHFALPPPATPMTAPERGTLWLKATLTSRVRQEKRAAIGWTGEAWVYVNGRLAYADSNLYQPAESRKAPDGRCSLENGSFVLPLEPGENEVAVALANASFGWGLMLRLDDLRDVTPPDVPGSGRAVLLFDQSKGESVASSQLAGIAERQELRLRLSVDPIAPETLRDVRLLCLRGPQTRLSQGEKDAIVAFVSKGGSLLLITDEDRGRNVLAETGMNDLIQPFGIRLTPDAGDLHNNGGLAKAGEIHRADLEIPFSGGRAVEGGTPFAFQLDEEGQPARPFATWKKVEGGGRIVVMGEAMASLFLGTKEGERLTGVPRDPSRTTYWGKDAGVFMEEVVAWLIAKE